MAGERVKLAVAERTLRGSAASRRLLKAGQIPGILYGQSSTPVAFQVVERDLRAALTTSAGMHAVLEVSVGGASSHSAILKEFQTGPVRGKLMHIDLQEVRLDQVIQTAVTVTLVGDAIGVREGGILNQVTQTINIEALPLEVPELLELDVSDLQIGDSLRLSALTVPDNITLLDDLEETVLATVSLAKVEVEEPVEGEEGEEGEEGAAEGEESAAGGDASGEESGGDEASAEDAGDTTEG